MECSHRKMENFSSEPRKQDLGRPLVVLVLIAGSVAASCTPCVAVTFQTQILPWDPLAPVTCLSLITSSSNPANGVDEVQRSKVTKPKFTQTAKGRTRTGFKFNGLCQSLSQKENLCKLRIKTAYGNANWLNAGSPEVAQVCN